MLTNVNKIWIKLCDYKANLENVVESCEITAQDETSLKQSIQHKLEEGWTPREIYNYMKWTEYFDDYTHEEDVCLNQMHLVYTDVMKRIV